MPFADDCVDIHAEPELPAVSEAAIVVELVELTGPDAELLRLLGERLGLTPKSVTRIALVALASHERRWW